jgi:hypothetical protein
MAKKAEPKQIKTYGTNYSQEAFYPVTSKGTYECANAFLNRGATSIPESLDKCFEKFPTIKNIAKDLGFLKTTGPTGASGPSGSAGPTGATTESYTLWKGATTVPETPDLISYEDGVDSYFDDNSVECVQITDKLGGDWQGCIWGSPGADYSCACPEIRPMFEAYAKLRLNNATFWNTPKQTPVDRAEFLDALKYAKKIDVTVAGDFSLKLGQLVYLNVNAASGYPYAETDSYTNGYYYIVGIKHVATPTSHEASLSLSQIGDLGATYI